MMSSDSSCSSVCLGVDDHFPKWTCLLGGGNVLSSQFTDSPVDGTALPLFTLTVPGTVSNTSLWSVPRDFQALGCGEQCNFLEVSALMASIFLAISSSLD